MPARILIVFLTILLLGACGDDDERSDPAATPTAHDGGLSGVPYPIADLTVQYTNPDVGLDSTYRISCQGDTAAVTGDDVGIVDRDACTALADPAVVRRLVDGPPPDQVCTDFFGGADVAEFTGTIDAQSVEARVDRENGCSIDAWDSLLVDLLPVPLGATPEPTASEERTPTPTQQGSEAAIETVDAYIAAVSAGDLGSAWDLVAESSRVALGGFDAFEALRSALSEGIGTWDKAQDQQHFAIPVEGADDAWAVTLLAVVPLEGPPALAATSMIVYTDTEPATVSSFENAFDDTGFVTFEPPAGSELDPDAQIRIQVPATAETVSAYIDATEVELQPATSGDQLVIADGPLAPGPHALTIIAEGSDGARTAIAAAYTTD